MFKLYYVRRQEIQVIKVKVTSRQGKIKVNVRSKQGQGNVRRGSRQSQGKAKARPRRGQGKVKVRSKLPKNNLNRKYNLMGFDTIEINLVFHFFKTFMFSYFSYFCQA